MSPLAAIRAQRAASEKDFQAAFETLLKDAETYAEAAITVQALHREVCALYAAEISLISNGVL